jgi:hypothetical protein
MGEQRTIITKHVVEVRKGEHVLELKIESRGKYGFAVRVLKHLIPPERKVCKCNKPPVVIEDTVDVAIEKMVNAHIAADPPPPPKLVLIKNP